MEQKVKMVFFSFYITVFSVILWRATKSDISHIVAGHKLRDITVFHSEILLEIIDSR
jgi:hypothetical protein